MNARRLNLDHYVSNAELILRRDPFLREVKDVLTDIVNSSEYADSSDDVTAMLKFGDAVNRARALLAKMNGDQP